MAKKILIVDDDPVLVKYTATLLTNNGYEAVGAEGGKTAFETALSEKPDLILLDLQMPEEWGPRFYRRLSKEESLSKIPVIVISGLAGKHAIPKAVAFLSKPYDPDKLLGIVKKTIG